MKILNADLENVKEMEYVVDKQQGLVGVNLLHGKAGSMVVPANWCFPNLLNIDSEMLFAGIIKLMSI